MYSLKPKQTNKQTNKHILYLPLLITGHVFIKTKTNKQTNKHILYHPCLYYIYPCLLLVMYSLKPKQTNKQTNKHILYLPLLITGHVFIKTKTNKQTNKQTHIISTPAYYWSCIH